MHYFQDSVLGKRKRLFNRLQSDHASNTDRRKAINSYLKDLRIQFTSERGMIYNPKLLVRLTNIFGLKFAIGSSQSRFVGTKALTLLWGK